MIPKRLVQFFFGPLDEDTSKKGVRQGDLVQAKNCQMLHAPEHIKRGGFAQAEHTFEDKQSVTPDLLVSPDKVIRLTTDSADDTVFAQSSAGGEWADKGGAQRLTVRSKLRFQSTVTAEKTAPMIKQAGDWFVWLDDDETLRYAQQDPDGRRLIQQSAAITVAGPAGGGSYGSTHIKSFALLYNETFDADNLWVYWVDWSTNAGAQQNRDGVWAMKIPLDWTAPTQYCVNSGTGDNLRILTGISATIVSGHAYLAACGIYLAVGDAVAFRSSSAGRGDTLSKFLEVDSDGAQVGYLRTYTRESTAYYWVASGVCWLSSTDYSYVDDHVYYAYWTKHATDNTLVDLILVDVTVSTGDCTGTTIASIALDDEVLPSTLSTYNNYIGQVTGREYSGGIYIIGSVRVSATNNGTQDWTDINTSVKADRVFTRCYTYTISGGAIATVWTARGSWLAHGLFARSDGNEFLITGLHDADETQLCYHLRRLTDGVIVTQFAYGEAAYCGGTGSSYGQFTYHVADLQQPYLAYQPFDDDYPGIVLSMTSASVTGSCDMAAMSVTRPTFQPPAIARDKVYLPGGVLTVAGGWQDVRESAPLVYPTGLLSFWGTGSS